MCISTSGHRTLRTGLGCRGGERRLLAEQVELSGFQTHLRMLERQLEPHPERTEQQPMFPPQLEQSLRLFVFFVCLFCLIFLRNLGLPLKHTRCSETQTVSLLVAVAGEM